MSSSHQGVPAILLSSTSSNHNIDVNNTNYISYLIGESALSEFRIQRLLQKLSTLNIWKTFGLLNNDDVQTIINAFKIKANWFYLVKHQNASIAQIGTLQGLLNLNEPIAQTPLAAGIATQQIYITPRVGTISSWASKAIEIAHHAGLNELQGIEKIMRLEFFIDFNELKNIDVSSAAAATQLIQNLLKTDAFINIFHDRMTQNIFANIQQTSILFQTLPSKNLRYIEANSANFTEINQELGLALSSQEIEYLVNAYQSRQQKATDVELMMFAQANSEHCRHKIFNASWVIDGVAKPHSLFQMIKHTHKTTPENTIVAYHDNASVMQGFVQNQYYADCQTRGYQKHQTLQHILMKVETHNHPTAIAPFEGAATGAGGEIRDEGATGIGGKPKAGLAGFTVSHLNLDLTIAGKNYGAWQSNYGYPERIANALEIMIQGPLGAAAFNNEFGRPNLLGYFRSFAQNVNGVEYGYHKPIMIAGGLGVIQAQHTAKKPLPKNTLLIQLGGPGMRIGMGGGAASSMSSGSNTASLDFDSVQRSNPEMERRAQEVINACISLGEQNPILAIHDVGAGGLSNAVPELVDLSGLGGHINLRSIHLAETGLSPAEIWCNESQERYVLAIAPDSLPLFQNMCQRERSLFCVLGYIVEHDAVQQEAILCVEDPENQTENQSDFKYPVNLPMQVLLGNTPKLEKHAKTKNSAENTAENSTLNNINLDEIDLADGLEMVLAHPSVACKQFLITIGDRSVGGLTHRDQMVGPWQTPVADCAVTLASFDSLKGEAMSMGERTPLAIYNSKAAAKMAIGEALTNLWAAPVKHLNQIKLSANWMAACSDGNDGEDAKLYEAVEAIAMDMCPALEISIPVGKDSLSMRTSWQDNGENKLVKSPVSLIVSAFAVVEDVEKTLTPLPNLQKSQEILLIDLGLGQQRLAGSILAQVYQQTAGTSPDVDDVAALKNAFHALNELKEIGAIFAYHDRSDGGLWTTLCEMAFAGRCGFALNIDMLNRSENDADDWGDAKDWRKQTQGRQNNKALAALLNEELGIVLQIDKTQREAVFSILQKHQLSKHSHIIGYFTAEENCIVMQDAQIIYQNTRATLQNIWSHVSQTIAGMRDHPSLVKTEYQNQQIKRLDNQGLHIDWQQAEPKPAEHAFNANISINLQLQKPKVAILREQGVNSHIEMAYAMELAGFECVDVHMSDLIQAADQNILQNMQGLIACGGFSYGDVLGAGQGWAKTILYNQNLAEQFAAFFQNTRNFALGVCNGCQMLSQLSPIIPGAADWPIFTRNLSEQYEARLSLVQIQQNNSIFLENMAGAVLPIVVAHGEGQAKFKSDADYQKISTRNGVPLRFVDGNQNIANSETYPENPNGSVEGLTAVVNQDGRIMAMMPHPERATRRVQLSYAGDYPYEFTPWLSMLNNAYAWAKGN